MRDLDGTGPADGPPAADAAPPAAVTKEQLRGWAMARRRSRPTADRRSIAALLQESVLVAARSHRWRRVCAYVPTPTEPGDTGLVEALHDAGLEVLLPVVVDGPDLDWGPFESIPALTPGRAAALEPGGGRLGPEAIRDVDAALVPALLVAADGTRLGRGAGCYDRALARVRPEGGTGSSSPPLFTVEIIAVVHDDEVVASLPKEDHDVRVSWVLTPTGGLSRLTGPDDPSRA